MKLLLPLLFLLSGCAKDPVSTERTTNSDIAVELLFEHEGVKVYRFIDGGRFVYYTDARGKTEWSVKQSKTVIKRQVDTVE